MYIRKTLAACTLFLATLASANEQLEFLGTPYIDTYPGGDQTYARNVWDMQLFNDRIYIGAGNSSNSGPAANAGRVPVIYYSITENKFVHEYTAAEEQLDKFKEQDSILFLPGHDATQKWTLGNIYYNTGSDWVKKRTLPEALHVYDIAVIGNQVFAAVGLNGSGAVYISEDNGNTWSSHSLGSGRVYSFITFRGQLFATRTFRTDSPDKVSVYKWNNIYSSFEPRPDLNISSLFPSTIIGSDSVKIFNSETSDNGTIYLAGYKHNDHQNKPISAYSITMKTESSATVDKVKLPVGYTPRDVIYRDNQFYILATDKTESGYSNAVFAGSPGQKSSWRQVVQFNYSSFSRSFEKTSNGCFYFGIGSEIESSSNWSFDELKSETGNIMRICI